MQNNQESTWQFRPDEGAAPQSPTPGADDQDAITWTAAEFLHHSKSIDWYLALAVVAILVAVGFHFLFHDLMTSLTPIFAALVFGFYGRRPPRQLQYRLDGHGLSIGSKLFPYPLFRSFAVQQEGPFTALVLLPLNRFGMLVTLYLDPKDETRILDLISEHLPMQPRSEDALDRFMKRIRF